jgi:hypothetical protein
MNKDIWFKILILFVFIGMILAGCAGSATPESEYIMSESAPYEEEMESPASRGVVFQEADFDENYSFSVAEAAQVPEERLVIKDANLVIVVDDPSLSLDRITRLAEDLGGFVVYANLYQTETSEGVKIPQASIAIRVPAEELSNALEKIKAESDQDPISQGISSQDVTGEYVDLQSRLNNLEATESQLLVIMEEAKRTEDVLAVYSQLTQVREEIEIIKGRMKFLEQSAALSSIQVELMANEAVQPLTVGGWQPTGVAKSAVQALINGLKFLVNLAIWLAIFVLPIALIVFVFVFLPVRWLIRRVRRSKKSKADTLQEQDPDTTSN